MAVRMTLAAMATPQRGQRASAACSGGKAASDSDGARHAVSPIQEHSANWRTLPLSVCRLTVQGCRTHSPRRTLRVVTATAQYFVMAPRVALCDRIYRTGSKLEVQRPACISSGRWIDSGRQISGDTVARDVAAEASAKPSGTNYVRVQSADGQMTLSSPISITTRWFRTKVRAVTAVRTRFETSSQVHLVSRWQSPLQQIRIT